MDHLAACGYLPGFLSDSAVECRGDLWPSVLATLLALAVAVAVFGWFLAKLFRELRVTGRARFGVWILTAFSVPLAAICLAMAAGDPYLIQNARSGDDHVIIAIDHSESAQRRPEERHAALAKVGSFLDRQKARDGRRVVVSIVAFADAVQTIANRIDPDAALGILERDQTPSGLSSGRSAIAEALRRSATVAAERPDSDMTILVTDGNETEEKLEGGLARDMFDAGPIFPVPINAGMPAEGIVSAYLPAAVEAGMEPKLRAVFDPGTSSQAPANWLISLSRNGTAIDLDQQTFAFDDKLRQVRLPLRFDGRGIQSSEIAFSSAERRYAQRLVTLVKGPLRVLAYGEGGFVDGLPKERFEVTKVQPDARVDLHDFDVVTIGELDASRFGKDVLGRMADAVRSSGIGLLLVNGPMLGTSQQPTVIQSYKDTPLDALLPVSADPRFLIEEPPPRDVIVMVDTSGSMGSEGINAARQAVGNILSYMRPMDRMNVIPFDLRGPGWVRTDGAGKAELAGFLAGLGVGGKSDASSAFEEAASKAGNYTAVFLITDGIVNDYDYRKDGMSFIYLEYGSSAAPTHPQIAGAAQQAEMLNPNSGIRYELKFFKPEERTEYFFPDPLRPRLVGDLQGVVAGIDTPGVALSYARADARRILISDKGEGEPVLAFRDAGGVGGGRTAAFLSHFGPAWVGTDQGRTAVEAILSHLASWSERQRYGFNFEDLGAALAVRIAVNGGPGHNILPSGLSATLVLEGPARGLTFAAAPEEPGTFVGRIDLPEGDRTTSHDGVLILQEGGAGAITGQQYIPVKLPSSTGGRAGVAEASSSGVDIATLEALASRTGGGFDRLPERDASSLASLPPATPLHLGLLAAAGGLFSIAMLGKEVKL